MWLYCTAAVCNRLFEAAEADLAAVKKVLEDTRLQGCVVRLRGLPYTATAADVVDFFQVGSSKHGQLRLGRYQQPADVLFIRHSGKPANFSQ